MSKENNKVLASTGPPVEIRPLNPEQPHGREFLRLPPSGRRCVETGMSRSSLNFLILPSAANNFSPPVRSFSLRRPGNRFGSRIIDFQSLRAFIHAHAELSAGPTPGKKGGAMPVNDTVGGDIISAWLVEPGVCWIQTSSARHARRLSQRSDTRIVGNGVVGGFLRIFEAQHSLSWAKRFIARHETNEVPTGAAFLNPESPTSRRNLELAVSGGRGNRTQQMGDGNNN
jgi:hypothetical protein